ncbi:mannosyl-glycoprotein endo-beta-N-acetylglucosaminidase [Paenibacillus taihuensis]|uniref:Mannosyl-glycoprotein endo-beta-N-acetylglucosaminidase n=1 Tax=Paenibacillus taihuensis TaxID=1156355 RepID=A0A3D9RJM4_9BACL|nr:glucosaminidase domain-containing protein [Paenibacillus taihuensis]REE80083.1 mannosyl-glycoprotein endo-beta-N-acetylglucosaminidase [Paenibacillus taihuensis]
MTTGQAAGVLTRTDIHNIRHYVQHKYGDLPSERRAEIVADAMQRIVLRQLPDFPAAYKKQVSSELLRSIAAGGQMPIQEKHIFEACMVLSYENEPILLEALHDWTERRLGVKLELESFRGIVEEAKHIISNPLLAVEAWDAVTGAAAVRTADSGVLAEVIALPLSSRGIKGKPRQFLIMAVLLGATMFGYASWSLPFSDTVAKTNKMPIAMEKKAEQAEVKQLQGGLPKELRYVEVDRTKLVQFLQKKSSLLAEEPYLSAIINAAKANNVHPLLLFAITGQEQAFVPKTTKNARKIANNPFNVFHSWQEFNTTISESARVAGKTINHISADRPADIDPFVWINLKYAEDPNWSNGVSRIMDTMVRQIMIE